jgi:hypothetical protein
VSGFKPQVVGGTDKEALMVKDLAKLAGLAPSGASAALEALNLCKSNIERIAMLGTMGVPVRKGREFLHKYGYGV